MPFYQELAPRVVNPSAVTQVLWTVRLLGRLEVVSDSVSLTRFRTLKAAALLAYLSLRKGQPQPREELMALLWPDASLEAARNNLSVVLSSLRHQLEPPGTVTERVFTADRQAIGIRAEALTTDIEAFQAAVRARRWDEAATAYQGPFLAGFYDDWVLLQRETLAQTYSRVIETLVKNAAPNLSQRLWEALQRDPDRADFYRELLPTAPLAVPREEPHTPTITVPPAAPETAPSRGFLPAYPTRFFGRTVEQGQLAVLLDHTRLVTLLGPGGIGKTRLAIESLVPRAEAGERVYFVPLVDITEGSQLLGALRAALRLPTARDEHAQLQEALAAQSTLLILDNAEQVVDHGLPAAVHALLESVPTLRLLVTSRKALSVPGEQLRRSIDARRTRRPLWTPTGPILRTHTT